MEHLEYLVLGYFFTNSNYFDLKVNPWSSFLTIGGFGLMGYSIWNFLTAPSSITFIQKRGPSRYFFGAVPTQNVADISIGGSNGASVSGSGNQSVTDD